MPAKPDGLPDSERPSQRLQSTSARDGRRALLMAPIVPTARQPAALDPTKKPSATRPTMAESEKESL